MIDRRFTVKDYKRIEKIGEGTYGVVYRAENLHTKQAVAMKKIRMDISQDGIPCTSLREISILQEISAHPNIVRLIDILIHKKCKLFLVFEFLLMDLRKYMDILESPMDYPLAVSYMYQICRALEFCHARRVIHRDLKPQNLLITSGGLIKLADFGLSRTVTIPVRIVTMWYRCPEVLLDMPKYSYPVDMWSVGCIFAEILTLRPLFKGDSEIDQLFKIFKIMGTPTVEEWSEIGNIKDFKATFPEWEPLPHNFYFPYITIEAFDLFKKLLKYNPARRLTAVEALRHPYFKNFPVSLLPEAPANNEVCLEPLSVGEFDESLQSHSNETSPQCNKLCQNDQQNI